MKNEAQIKELALEQYPIKDGTTDADRDTLLTFQNILIKGYKQALSDIQEERQSEADQMPEVLNWLIRNNYINSYNTGKELCQIFKLNHKKACNQQK